MAVLVIGGTRGIGRAVVEGQLRLGRDRVIAVYSKDDAAASELRKAHGDSASLETLKVDVSSADECKRLRRELDRLLVGSEPLRGVVHCAVDPAPGKILEWDEASIVRAWKVSALSLALVVGAVVDAMPAGGSIVYVSGGAPSRTIPGLAGLGASKASGETIARYLARELADRRIRVNTVRSGQVATETYLASRFGDASGKPPEVTPLGRPLEPDDVARAVAFLLSDEAAMITGVMLPADGGRNLT
jgi:NAD(P)-dependent dehydrogenase (short-subunit alcohol dehydrogenase family)